MTDRSRQAIITFDRDIRDDDFEHYRAVIESIKGVVRVDQLSPDVERDVQDMAEYRVKAEWRDKVVAFLWGSLDDDNDRGLLR